MSGLNVNAHSHLSLASRLKPCYIGTNWIPTAKAIFAPGIEIQANFSKKATLKFEWVFTFKPGIKI